MFKLFDFQEKAYKKGVNFLKNNDTKKGGLIIVPTAGGKSIIIAKIAKELDNVLVIVPSIELLNQNLNAMQKEGLEVGVYSASANSKVIGSRYTIATIASLKDKGLEFKNKGVNKVIVDEAHFKFSCKTTLDKKTDELVDGVFKAFIKDLKPKSILGLTATPFVSGVLNGKHAIRSMHKTRDSLFKHIVHITQVKDVIEANRWSKIVYDIHPVNCSSLKANSSGSEYTSESIKLFNKENNINNRICLLLKRLEGKKGLVFVESVEVAKTIRDWYNSKGYSTSSEVISGDMDSKYREQVIDSFKSSDSTLKVLINYGTLTTGFDDPLVTFLIGGRATMSLSLYYQILGRLTRVHPDKKEGLYIDLVGNFNNFGAIEEFNFDDVGGFGVSLFCGDVLITDIPSHSSIKVTKSFLRSPPNFKKITNKDLKMWFGKFEGKFVRMLPNYYRDFLSNSLLPPLTDKQQELKQLLEELNENEFLRLFKNNKAS